MNHFWRYMQRFSASRRSAFSNIKTCHQESCKASRRYGRTTSILKLKFQGEFFALFKEDLPSGPACRCKLDNPVVLTKSLSEIAQLHAFIFLFSRSLVSWGRNSTWIQGASMSLNQDSLYVRFLARKTRTGLRQGKQKGEILRGIVTKSFFEPRKKLDEK